MHATNKLTKQAEVEMEKANQKMIYYHLHRPGSSYCGNIKLTHAKIEEEYNYWLGRRSSLENIAWCDDKTVVGIFKEYYGLTPAYSETAKNPHQRGWLSAIVDFFPLYIKEYLNDEESNQAKHKAISFVITGKSSRKIQELLSLRMRKLFLRILNQYNNN